MGLVLVEGDIKGSARGVCCEVWFKAGSTVVVEGFIKAWQGEVCGEMRLKVVSLVLVEGGIKARQGVFVARYGVNPAVYKRKVEIVI